MIDGKPPFPAAAAETMTSSPMDAASWNHKKVGPTYAKKTKTAGRSRARKRSNLYNSLASYQNSFLSMVTAEYRTEEEEVLGRINNSLDDPLALETAGHALYDLYPERRGNLFSDEVYRLTKAKDATTFYEFGLPPYCKFSSNDIIMLTLQTRGSGDFFDKSTLPTSADAIAIEARVLNTGPTYVDIALLGGAFESAFGPAPNNVGPSGKGNKHMRLRADRFFSNIPYERMVAALTQFTAIPDSPKSKDADAPPGKKAVTATATPKNPYDKIQMDELLREAILATYAYTDSSNYLFRDAEACDLPQLARNLAKPPLPNSPKLASQALSYIQSSNVFHEFNEPQLTAIEAALTRRLTLIQGPPGTGKTTVASSVAFGFVHQCRSISPCTKVLACAFSNVGADNLAESILKLGLKVVRVGKASATSESLWNNTLDAAIDADPNAQKALAYAAWATSQLTKKHPMKKGDSLKSKSSSLKERGKQEIATKAVKDSIQASNIAATKALRAADVIVCTSIGAADRRLLAACGIVMDDDDEVQEDARLENRKRKTGAFSKASKDQKSAAARRAAPDGLPPLSLSFVIVDEACQSVEPANLIPLIATNSCRALVLLGDPCQLPPTVKSDPSSPLSMSLMERLAVTLPHPVIVTARADSTNSDDTYLDSKPIKQSVSLLRSREDGRGHQHVVYRKRFSGSLLLSVQYRMHPSISAFSSALFYDGLLSTPSFLGRYRQFPKELNRILPAENSDLGVRFIDVGGRCNERRGAASGRASTEQTSYRNEPEAIQVMVLVKKMLRESQKGSSPKSIGIVTPYNGQVEFIKSLMTFDKEYQELAVALPFPIEVKSVDGYQGRERDLIIFSTVRSNRQGNVGFLADWRRMNVALTRAKSALIIVGDLDTLEEGDKHWAAFGKFCRGMRAVIESTDQLSPSS